MPPATYRDGETRLVMMVVPVVVAPMVVVRGQQHWLPTKDYQKTQ
jgi:hypothetical protein